MVTVNNTLLAVPVMVLGPPKDGQSVFAIKCTAA